MWAIDWNVKTNKFVRRKQWGPRNGILTWYRLAMNRIDSNSWRKHWTFDWTIARTQRPALICKRSTSHRWWAYSWAFGRTFGQRWQPFRPFPDGMLNRKGIWRSISHPPICILRFPFCPICIRRECVWHCPGLCSMQANSMDWSTRRNVLPDSDSLPDRISVWWDRCPVVSSF